MKRFLAIVLVLSMAATAIAQRGTARNFTYTLKGGVNLCQIDGDGNGSFNHIGWNFGVNTSFPFSQDNIQLRMLVEIGVTNKGSYVEGIDRSVSLTYIEVPLLVTYNFGNHSGSAFRIGAGVAPAILGKADVNDHGEVNSLQQGNFRRMDILPLCLDLQYRFNAHIGIEVRYYNSLLPITDQNASGTYRIFRDNKGSFNRLVTAGLSYRL